MTKKAALTDKKEFYKELCSLAVPIGLQNLLLALIGASDALMLGRLTQDAISAVSLANQVAFIMNLFIGAVIGGASVLISQYWGKGDRQMAKNLLCFFLKIGFAISVVFFLLTLFAPRFLMLVYTSDETLIEIGASYLRIIGVSYLFSSVTQGFFMVMRIEGKAAKTVIISVATLVADMTIDFFLIYGVAGAPKLGANGSACSTVAVEFIGMIWCIAESRRKDTIHPDLQGFQWFSKDVAKDLLGISAGAGIMIGKLLGQDLLEKAKEYGRKFCHISFLTGAFHMVLLCLLGPAVAAFFVLSDTAKRYLIIMLVFSALYVFAYSINTIIVCGIFPAGGDAKYDAVSVFFATWCFSLPLALLGTFVCKWPVMLIYILMCADEIVKLPWLLPRYKKYIWLKNLTR